MSWFAVAAVIGWVAALASAPAVAQDRRQSQQARQVVSQSEPRQSQGPMLALVSIGSQRLTVWDRNGIVASSPISSGKRGHESPQGVFSIIEKKEEHFSNLYDDAEMPWMQRLTWSGVAFHAGALPGYPASRGCFRLPHGFAQSWFNMTRLNTRVIVTPYEVAPVAISHPRLFQPRIAAVEAAPAPSTDRSSPDAAPAAPRPAPVLQREDGTSEAPMMLGGRLPRPDVAPSASTTPAPQRAVTSPMALAQARRAETAKAHADAVKAADEARVTLRSRQVEAAKTDRSAKAAQTAQKQAEARLAGAQRVLAAARTDDARRNAEAARAKTAEEVERLTKAAEAARTLAAERAAGVREAQESIKTLDKARDTARAEARDAARLTEPVSVFVSREMGRVYVRQNREPVMDMPVVIRDRDQPIGTHVFTAMEATAGGGMKWSVVNAAPANPITIPVAAQPRGRGQAAAPSPRPQIDSLGEGKAALDRIELPQEVLDRVLPYVHVGSSLIVSDLPPSFETGQATDFIVQTKGEEEARESVRRIIEERKVEKANARREREGWLGADGRVRYEEVGSRQARISDDRRQRGSGRSDRRGDRRNESAWGGNGWGGGWGGNDGRRGGGWSPWGN